MKRKGILRGDKSFKHFTFDDEMIEVRAGKKYYSVTIPKDPLEGEYGEDEVRLVPVDDVMIMGVRNRKPETKTEQEPETPKTPTESTKKTSVGKKPTKTKKVKETTPNDVCVTNMVIQQPQSISTSSDKFEYYVSGISADDIGELQEELNKLGELGWEMCGFDVVKSLVGKKISIISIMKRKKGEN